MAEDYSGKKLVLVARKIVLGCKNRGSIAIANKSFFVPKKTQVVVHQQKN